MNVQGLKVAKSVEVRNLLRERGRIGGNSKNVLGLVETHEKFNKIDRGLDVDHIEQMREQTDKKGGGLTLLKGTRGGK